MSKFRRAVVTGGTGFLGSRVCRRLLEQGTAVVCLDNFLTGSRGAIPALPGGPPLDLRVCDITEPFEVTGRVDLVMHLASPASAADYARYPLETMYSGSLGTRNALRLAAGKGARFVLASTCEVYGEALAAAYRRAGHADTAVARIFNSYGPGMRRTTAGWCPRSPARRCAVSRSRSPATGRRPARSATPTTPCADCCCWRPATSPARSTWAIRTRPPAAVPREEGPAASWLREQESQPGEETRPDQEAPAGATAPAGDTR